MDYGGPGLARWCWGHSDKDNPESSSHGLMAGGGTRGYGNPEEMPDLSWEVSENILEEETCELSPEERARWVPGEEGIHDRAMAYTKARSEGKGGTFEEQNEWQQVRVRMEDGD